jgi:hypothetical protein
VLVDVLVLVLVDVEGLHTSRGARWNAGPGSRAREPEPGGQTRNPNNPNRHQHQDRDRDRYRTSTSTGRSTSVSTGIGPPKCDESFSVDVDVIANVVGEREGWTARADGQGPICTRLDP